MSRRKRSRLAGTGKAKSQSRARRVKKPNKEHLAGMLDWLLPDGSIFSKMRLHGNTKWLPKCLVCLALFWAWSESKHLTDAYAEAVQCCQSLFQSVVLSTYQGFMGALTRWTATLMNILWPLLHERMEEIGGRFWRIHGWVPIAFDGSRSTAPRTKDNEEAFCAQHYGQRQDRQVSQEERPKACGEKTMRRTSRSLKSRKRGSPCCGIWAFACLGCGGWAPRIRANGIT